METKKLEQKKNRIQNKIEKLQNQISDLKLELTQVDGEIKNVEIKMEENIKLKSDLNINSQRENSILRILTQLKNEEFVSLDDLKHILKENNN